MDVSKEDIKKAEETAKILKQLEKKQDDTLNKVKKPETQLEDLKK